MRTKDVSGARTGLFWDLSVPDGWNVCFLLWVKKRWLMNRLLRGSKVQLLYACELE